MEHKKHYSGLTDEQVLESRKLHGFNLITPPKRESLWKHYLEKFRDPVIRILLIAAFLSLGISFIDKEFAETIGIFCAIFLATGVAFWFETDAGRKFDILNQVNDETLFKVIRNSNVCEVPKRDIVVGEIVLMNAGEEVPADGELKEAVSLQVDESCLTGEPMIEKTTNPADFDPESMYPNNWLMRGTKVMDGHAVFEVRQVGDATEFGKVATEATEMRREVTPLNSQLERLSKLIGVVGFSLALLTFVSLFVKDIFLGNSNHTVKQLGSIGIVIISAMIALAKVWIPIVYDAFALLGKPKDLPKSIGVGSWIKWIGLGLLTFILLGLAGIALGIDPLNPDSWISSDVAERILQYFMVAVALIVVAVPEGLPMSVTLSLALSMRKMLQSNNLVRKMHACETIGAATVICTDKTGTLTQNQMQVAHTNFFALSDQVIADDEISNLIKENISVNSTAFIDFSNPRRLKALGNPTEAALLLWLNSYNVNYLQIREEAVIIEQLTFSAERKYMATIADSPLLGKRILYVKGAPEILLSKCSRVLYDNESKPVGSVAFEIENLLLDYQNKAMRTLGFAYEIIEDDQQRIINGKLVNTNLAFIGIAAITDHVREEVPGAVKKCMEAGIEIKMVTGDTSGTSMEVGRRIGIWTDTDTNDNIITGVDFEKLSEEKASQKVKQLKIMCRARPTDKQRLVQLLQRAGSIVAVTGDGTNDAPALNFANVGLSMGSGTSVAKEASDITLLDDSFNSIATAVMWGRSLYKNIQRFILFQLTINGAALLIVLFGSIFGNELPLTIAQILWVNLIMDTLAAGALASLPPDEKVMREKPRKSSDFIITPSMRSNILWIGLLFFGILVGLNIYFNRNGGFEWDKTSVSAVSNRNMTFFFTFFVFLQFWNMFNAKAFATGSSAFKGLYKCTGFMISLIIILTGQILIVEFGGEVFRTIPLSLRDWLTIICITSIVLWAGEINRFLKARINSTMKKQ
jgi:Ca2+-transporting ATPase